MISFLHTPSPASSFAADDAFLLLLFDLDEEDDDEEEESGFLTLPLPPPPRNGTMARDEKDAAIPSRGGRRWCSRRAARDSRRAHVPTSAATACARLIPIALARSLLAVVFVSLLALFLEGLCLSLWRALRFAFPFPAAAGWWRCARRFAGYL